MPETASTVVPYTIHYKNSRRARYLRITLRPDCLVSVTIPRGVSRLHVQEFVTSRQTWIQKHLAKYQERQRQIPAADLSAIDLGQKQSDLFRRLEAFSRQHQLIYRKAAFRCQKTKWGSCSTAGSINLNINMVMLPEHLQDYILLHELTHLRHPNHSHRFWRQLDQFCGGHAKAWAKEIRNYPLTLIRAPK